MKYITTLLLVFVLSVSGFAQKVQFDLSGSYARPIKKDQLQQANTLSDIRSTYPSNWVSDYNSVEVQASVDGVIQKATGKSDVLNESQKSLLSSADLGSDITFIISHNYNNPVTHAAEPRMIQFSYTLVPAQEATYTGGRSQLDTYLKESAIDQIPDDIAENFGRAVITFTVDEEGKVQNAKVKESCGDRKIDKQLLRSIKNMSDWQPALDASGKKVKQAFQFTVGSPDC